MTPSKVKRVSWTRLDVFRSSYQSVSEYICFQTSGSFSRFAGRRNLSTDNTTPTHTPRATRTSIIPAASGGRRSKRTTPVTRRRSKPAPPPESSDVTSKDEETSDTQAEQSTSASEYVPNNTASDEGTDASVNNTVECGTMLWRQQQNNGSAHFIAFKDKFTSV